MEQKLPFIASEQSISCWHSLPSLLQVSMLVASMLFGVPLVCWSLPIVFGLERCTSTGFSRVTHLLPIPWVPTGMRHCKEKGQTGVSRAHSSPSCDNSSRVNLVEHPYRLFAASSSHYCNSSWIGTRCLSRVSVEQEELCTIYSILCNVNKVQSTISYNRDNNIQVGWPIIGTLVKQSDLGVCCGKCGCTI